MEAQELSKEPQGKKIFHVYKGYGDDTNVGSTLGFLFRNIRHEQRILETIMSHGYEIVEEGSFNERNPQEIMISSDHDVTIVERERAVAEQVGISMPKEYLPQEIISIDVPVVSKVDGFDRGELKYLLETKNQKMKYLSWAILGQKIGSFAYNPDYNKELEKVFRDVEHGQFKSNNGGFLDGCRFEEFIQTPGDFFTSLRVVVDAFGVIHYSQVNRSERRKKDLKIMEPYYQTDNPLKEVSKAGSSLSLVLRHPNNPFYLASKQFLSNVYQGGTPILLNELPADDSTNREVLTSLGLNPDRPQLPANLVDLSVKIGKKYRKFYPYVGIDYMLRDNPREYVLLEINKGPSLRPEGLGLPKDTDAAVCELAMLDRVLK